MPRVYKHKLGTPFRQNYSKDNVELALMAVVEERMPFRQYAVPKSTIYRKYRGLHSDQLGKPPVLSKTEEQKIVNATLITSGYGYPFTTHMLKQFVQQYLNQKGINIKCFVENLPGNDWVQAFLRRNPELTQRMSQNIKTVRAEISKEVISEYFNELQQSIAGIPPENCINYDETNLADNPGNVNVLARRGCKRVERFIDSSKSSTSIMFAITGNGIMLPPYVVFSGKNLYPNWVEDGPPGARYNQTDSGWFDSDVFEDWFNTIALTFLKHKEGKNV